MVRENAPKAVGEPCSQGEVEYPSLEPPSPVSREADDNVSQDEDGGDEIVSQEADEEVTELESSPDSAFESENFEEAPELPNSGISNLAAISDSSITSVLNKASEIQKMNGPTTG